MRYLRYPPAWHPARLPGPLPGAVAHSAAMFLAAKTVSQVIDSTTVWLVGILAGLATLMLTVGGVRYLMAGGDPAEVQKAKIALRSSGHRLRPGRPGARHRRDPEVPDRRPMTAPAPHPVLAACGFLDFTCQISQSITSWFASLVESAVNPVLGIIGNDLLSTPQPGSFPAVTGMWGTSLAIADAAYVLFVLAGGILLMGYETVQVSTSAKEIAPRLFLGLAAANLSLIFISRAIDLGNGLASALAGQGADPAVRRPGAGEHDPQLDLHRRDLHHPARPGRGDPGPGAGRDVRAAADGGHLADRGRAAGAGLLRAAADRLGGAVVVAGDDRAHGHPRRPGPGADRGGQGVLHHRLGQHQTSASTCCTCSSRSACCTS